MKRTLLLALIFGTIELGAQPGNGVTVQGDAKVGFISTGTSANINVTQIFGKSPEYDELKRQLETLDVRIKAKSEKCAKYVDVAAKNDCREEIIALNLERDSIQKLESRFREDVIRLAEFFTKIPINSERLWLAKQFFDEGKIREAYNILNAIEMQKEGDALLAKKARKQQELQTIDSLLLVKADEFALKASLKITDYADPMRYDSAQIYFEQSRQYAETVDNLYAFAFLLCRNNQTPRAIEYLEKAISLASSENEIALLSDVLGTAYGDVQRIPESEQMYLQSLEILEQLAKSNPEQFEPELAGLVNDLGLFYARVQNISEAERMYLRAMKVLVGLVKSNHLEFEQDLASVAVNLGSIYALIQKTADSEKMLIYSFKIYERLAENNPAQFEWNLAAVSVHLGKLYTEIQRIPEAEKMYLRALEIFERLVKSNSDAFEPDLANTLINFGIFYSKIQKMSESEKMHLHAFEIYERLAISNPAKFEPDLARMMASLASLYEDCQRIPEAEKMYLRALEIFESLVKNNSDAFEPDLAKTMMKLGMLYANLQKVTESENLSLSSLEIYERLAISDPAQFESDLAGVANNLGLLYFSVNSFSESEKMYLRALDIDERLAKNSPVQFETDLVRVANNLGMLYYAVQNFSESEKMYLRALDIEEQWAKTNPVQFEPDLAVLLGNYGSFLMLQGQFLKSMDINNRVLMMHQKQMLNGQLHHRGNFEWVYNSVATLRDSFLIHHDYISAIAIQLRISDCMYNLRHIDIEFLSKAGEDYNNLAWYYLLSKQFKAAELYARKAIEINPRRPWYQNNLAHALLLQGKYTEAEGFYSGLAKDGITSWLPVLYELDELEAAGITCPEIKKVREWLGK